MLIVYMYRLLLRCPVPTELRRYRGCDSLGVEVLATWRLKPFRGGDVCTCGPSAAAAGATSATSQPGEGARDAAGQRRAQHALHRAVHQQLGEQVDLRRLRQPLGVPAADG